MNQVLLTNGPLRLRFEKHGDRYAQIIEVSDSHSWSPIAQSVEGTDDQSWPHSPPWQELITEQRGPDQQIIFTVGKAGTAHWSGSFSMQPAGGIRCEIACRTGRVPNFVGTTYRSVMKDLPEQFQIRTTTETRLAREPREFTLKPYSIPLQFPATLVWNYTIEWNTPS
jgi:hypothetical protein